MDLAEHLELQQKEMKRRYDMIVQLQKRILELEIIIAKKNLQIIKYETQ
jgi:hypothetical protein